MIQKMGKTRHKQFLMLQMNFFDVYRNVINKFIFELNKWIFIGRSVWHGCERCKNFANGGTLE